MFRHDFAISKCAAKAIQPIRGFAVDLRMRAVPQRDRFDPPKVRRWFTLRAQNAHRATARASRPAQSAQRVHFAISRCEPRHSESDLTHPKRTKGSQKVHRATARAIRPAKARRGFTLQSPNAHHAAARALRLPRLLHASWKHCACHEICTKSSKVLRLPRNLHEQLKREMTLQRHAKRSKCCACHESAQKALKRCACHEICTNSSKVLRLSREMTLQRHAKRSKYCACHEIRI